MQNVFNEDYYICISSVMSCIIIYKSDCLILHVTWDRVPRVLPFKIQITVFTQWDSYNFGMNS